MMLIHVSLQVVKTMSFELALADPTSERLVLVGGHLMTLEVPEGAEGLVAAGCGAAVLSIVASHVFPSGYWSASKPINLHVLLLY